jgi:hypothetical protein
MGDFWPDDPSPTNQAAIEREVGDSAAETMLPPSHISTGIGIQ